MMGHFTPTPPAAVSRVLASFDRDQLAGFVAVAINLLDLADGDSDIEGDDADLEESDPPEDDDPREDDSQDLCLAGDDAVFAGAAIRAIYGGFSDRPLGTSSAWMRIWRALVGPPSVLSASLAQTVIER